MSSQSNANGFINQITKEVAYAINRLNILKGNKMEYKQYLPLGLLSAFVLKSLILGTNLADMGVIFSLVALVSLKEFLDRHKKMKEIEDFVKSEVSEFKNVIQKQNEVIELMSKKIQENNTKVSSLTMAQGMKSRIG
jgi:hypothetical protein